MTVKALRVLYNIGEEGDCFKSKNITQQDLHGSLFDSSI